MKPFEIYSWQPPGWPEPHPCVVISHPSRAANKPDVEVLLCSTKAATRAANPAEVILDAADGLNWPTLCKCDLIYAAPRDQIKNRRGEVSPLRQTQIIRAIISGHGWAEVLASA